MSILLVLALTVPQGVGDLRERCSDPVGDQDAAQCSYLKQIDELEIRSVESVAVGTEDEMRSLRPKARKCGLINRIDYVGPEVSVFDIVNAEPKQRDCLTSWIEAKAPHLAFSESKLQSLVAASSLLENKE